MMGLHILYVDGCVYDCFGSLRRESHPWKVSTAVSLIVMHCAIPDIITDKRLHDLR